jgi:predicted RNA-binding protein with PUA-like domain
MSNPPISVVSRWLFKSEPEEFSIDHLAKAARQTAPWTGVRNYQSRNSLRDDVKLGDLVFFYHSSTKFTGVAGICRITRAAYPDPTALNKKDPYYDPKATEENPIWVAVDVTLDRKFRRLVLLDDMKRTPGLEEMMVCKRGARLSIQPVRPAEWEIVVALGDSL